MPSATEKFSETKTGANDLNLLAEWSRNDFSLGYVMYRRTLTDAIAWQLTMETVEGTVVVVRAEPIWIGTSWFLAGPLPMRAGDKLRFTTTGALAGEDHTAEMLLRVGLH
jgi:hypothetical protein